MEKVISNASKNIYSFLWAIFLYSTPGWDLIRNNKSHVLKWFKRKINTVNERIAEYGALFIKNPHIINTKQYFPGF